MNVYKSIIVTDIHLRSNDSLIPEKDNDGRNIRTKDKIKFINQAINFAIKKEANSFIVAGDLFHHNRPSNRLRAASISLISKLIKNNIKTYLIPGNHDMSSTYYNLHSETYLNDNLILANNEVININDYFNIHLLGWGNQNKLLKETDKKTLLISHLQIKNAQYGNEMIAEEGLEKDSKELNPYEHCFLGHIHKRQTKDNYTYIGSLCKNDFKEINNPTGFMYLRINKNKYKSDFINNNDRILEKYSIEIKSEEEIYKFFNDKNIEDKIIRLEVDHPKDLFLDTYRIKKNLIEENNPLVIKISYNKNTDLKEKSIKVNVKGQEAFNEFIHKKDVPDKYIKLGKKILKKAEEEND